MSARASWLANAPQETKVSGRYQGIARRAAFGEGSAKYILLQPGRSGSRHAAMSGRPTGREPFLCRCQHGGQRHGPRLAPGFGYAQALLGCEPAWGRRSARRAARRGCTTNPRHKCRQSVVYLWRMQIPTHSSRVFVQQSSKGIQGGHDVSSIGIDLHITSKRDRPSPEALSRVGLASTWLP